MAQKFADELLCLSSDQRTEVLLQTFKIIEKYLLKNYENNNALRD
jgi:hypothetical protein